MAVAFMIKKVTIYDWAGGSSASEFGLVHNSVNEMNDEELASTVKRIFDHGFNVMLAHEKEQDAVLLCIDTKRFTQR